MAKTKCVFTVTTYNQRGSIESVINFGVARLPNRKQMALFIGEGAEITPIAYFKDDTHAELFRRILNIWKEHSYRIG